MNIIDAAYATTHDYPGGTVSLAPRMGMSSAVLRGKVNPNDAGHKLTVGEAVKMQDITGDHRIMLAMSDHLGYTCIKLPMPGASDMEMLDAFLEVSKELGEMSREFQSDWSDGKIDPVELDRLRSRLYALQQAVAYLMARIESLASQS